MMKTETDSNRNIDSGIAAIGENDIKEWFGRGDWLKGWVVKPDKSVDPGKLLRYYLKNRDRWEKMFAFLSSTDLAGIDTGRYEIDGTDLYALVSEYMPKNENDAHFELHRKYVDMQYVISGKERIGLAPLIMLDEVVKPYNPEKDVEFVSVKEYVDLKASPSTFFLFFPDEIHRPGVDDGLDSIIRKIVVKLKIT